MLSRILTVATAVGLLAVPALAQDDAARAAFQGRTVRIVVGVDAGGTYSNYAQLLASHMNRHIPGQPSVIVQHMPGAGGVKAINYVYNAMPKDGLGLIVPVDTLAVAQLVFAAEARYDASKLNWLGTVVPSNAVLVVRADSGVTGIEALKAKQLVVGSTGKASQTYIVPAMLNGLMGTSIKVVMGYRGSAKAMLAMEQGELQGASFTWGAWKLTRPEWFRNGYAVPLLQVGDRPEPDLPNVPMAQDLVQGEDAKRVVRFVSSMGAVGRSLAAPPKVAGDRLAALRAAFDATMADPAFRADAARRNLEVAPRQAKAVSDYVADVMKLTPAQLHTAKRALLGKVRGS